MSSESGSSSEGESKSKSSESASSSASSASSSSESREQMPAGHHVELAPKKIALNSIFAKAKHPESSSSSSESTKVTNNLSTAGMINIQTFHQINETTNETIKLLQQITAVIGVDKDGQMSAASIILAEKLSNKFHHVKDDLREKIDAVLPFCSEIDGRGITTYWIALFQAAWARQLTEEKLADKIEAYSDELDLQLSSCLVRILMQKFGTDSTGHAPRNVRNAFS